MRYFRLAGSLFAVVALAFALAGTGCNKGDTKGDGQAKAKSDPTTAKTVGATAAAHEGWWCQEHGVPEELCSICMSEVAAKKKFKDNGDWCKEHDRAESQCFKCDPKRYKKFEDMYVAKYGKKPAPPPKEEFEKQ
jgi:hypothetical protein